MKEKGWYSGDNHFHVVHGENQYGADISYAALVAKGEGLDYVHVCQYWDNSKKFYSPQTLQKNAQSTVAKILLFFTIGNLRVRPGIS